MDQNKNLSFYFFYFFISHFSDGVSLVLSKISPCNLNVNSTSKGVVANLGAAECE